MSFDDFVTHLLLKTEQLSNRFVRSWNCSQEGSTLEIVKVKLNIFFCLLTVDYLFWRVCWSVGRGVTWKRLLSSGQMLVLCTKVIFQITCSRSHSLSQHSYTSPGFGLRRGQGSSVRNKTCRISSIFPLGGKIGSAERAHLLLSSYQNTVNPFPSVHLNSITLLPFCCK